MAVTGNTKNERKISLLTGHTPQPVSTYNGTSGVQPVSNPGSPGWYNGGSAHVNNNGMTHMNNGYNGLQGLSQTTSEHMQNAQQGYQAGDAVSQAQQTLQQIQNNKPQSYNSKYQPAMDSILEQIQNPKEFKYEFNGDNLFKGYADLYTQKAKQASADAMGQAAALTGGYGNSYAQMVGNQQYQQNLLPLYDKGIELYDRAYQKYRDDQAELQNRYGLLSGADDTAYGRYRDDVGDWQTEEQQAYNRFQDAQNFDYTQYQNDLNYWTGLAQIENAAWATEQQRQDAIAQWNQQYALQQQQFQAEQDQYKQQVAMQYAMQILANGQMPSAELLIAAGISEEDARKMMAQLQASGGGGGGGYNPSTNYQANYPTLPQVANTVIGDSTAAAFSAATFQLPGQQAQQNGILNGMQNYTPTALANYAQQLAQQDDNSMVHLNTVNTGTPWAPTAPHYVSTTMTGNDYDNKIQQILEEQHKPYSNKR